MESRGYWIPFVAGGIGDATACLISHPMDVAKVRLQLKGELSSIPQPTGIRNIMQTLRAILVTEGIRRGIYTGLSAAILRQLTFSSLRHGLFFNFHELWKRKYHTPMPLLYQVLNSAWIGALCAFIANPCDVVLIRMQADGHWPDTQRRNYRNVFHGFSSIVSTEGISCLWRGYQATMLRGVLVTCSQLPAYHTSKYYLIQTGYFHQDAISTHFLSSIISAIVASIVTCPTDVIKTRLMNMKKLSASSLGVDVTSTSIGKQQSSFLYNGVLDCFWKIYSTEGVRGFYKGLGATIGRLGPHTIVLWQIQELLLRTFRSWIQE